MFITKSQLLKIISEEIPPVLTPGLKPKFISQMGEKKFIEIINPVIQILNNTESYTEFVKKCFIILTGIKDRYLGMRLPVFDDNQINFKFKNPKVMQELRDLFNLYGILRVNDKQIQDFVRLVYKHPEPLATYKVFKLHDIYYKKYSSELNTAANNTIDNIEEPKPFDPREPETEPAAGKGTVNLRAPLKESKIIVVLR